MFKILLIEDERDAAADITDLLQTRGYEVTPAYTAREALQALQEDKFDLAIIDLILPDMEGNAICALIRRDDRLKELPIIISTALGDSATEETMRGMGANEFLAKPYSMEALLEAVKRCVK